MQTKIHPQYNTDVKVTCASCGNTFVTGSTKQEIRIDVCSSCHPLYTGEHRFMDVRGRVENFQKKQQAAEAYQQKYGNKKKKESKKEDQPKSLRELLGEI